MCLSLWLVLSLYHESKEMCLSLSIVLSLYHESKEMCLSLSTVLSLYHESKEMCLSLHQYCHCTMRVKRCVSAFSCCAEHFHWHWAGKSSVWSHSLQYGNQHKYSAWNSFIWLQFTLLGILVESEFYLLSPSTTCWVRVLLVATIAVETKYAKAVKSIVNCLRDSRQRYYLILWAEVATDVSDHDQQHRRPGCHQ